MIDLHNHLLPGIDDGPAGMADAVEMARLAVAEGITHLMCTPHVYRGVFDNDAAGIARALEGYRAALTEAEVPLAVGAAAEVRCDASVIHEVAAGTLPLLGHWAGRDVLLLEFPHRGLPPGADRLTAWLIERDVIPLIAHPERNRDVVEAPEALAVFQAQGCLFQVTAGALTGDFGRTVQQRAEQLVAEGVAACLASDAHDCHRRRPGLNEGLEAATRLIGSDAARRLVVDHPWAIVAEHFKAI